MVVSTSDPVPSVSQLNCHLYGLGQMVELWMRILPIDPTQMRVPGTFPSKGCQAPCLPMKEWLWMNGFLAARIIPHLLNQVLTLTIVLVPPIIEVKC